MRELMWIQTRRRGTASIAASLAAYRRSFIMGTTRPLGNDECCHHHGGLAAGFPGRMEVEAGGYWVF